MAENILGKALFFLTVMLVTLIFTLHEMASFLDCLSVFIACGNKHLKYFDKNASKFIYNMLEISQSIDSSMRILKNFYNLV